VNRFVDVTDVNVTIGAGCRFHGLVSIKKKLPGDARTAIITALSSTKDMKHVFIFDDDIDIFDPGDVEGAIASRVQASNDVIIIPGAQGTGLDPSHLLNNTSDKMGVDATKPLGEEAIGFEKAAIPGYDDIDLEKCFPGVELEGRKR
jgi:2,5-furandicarboxylate decarboxylase 1